MSALSAATGVLVTIHPEMLDVMSMSQFLRMTADLMDVIADSGADMSHDWMRYLLTRYEPTDAPQNELITIASPVQTPGFGVVKVVKIGDYTYRLDRGTVAGLTGSYLYANHFAGGVCLTRPVLIACCIRLLRGQIPAIMNSSIAIGLAAFGLWSVSSFAHSRAGTVSLMVAFLVLLAALIPKGKISATFAAIAGLAFLATTSLLLLILGAFGNPAALLPARLAPLIPDVETDPRAVAARIAVRAFLASPILGTGLNTYSDVFPRFTRMVTPCSTPTTIMRSSLRNAEWWEC
jgi:hypothetical protein